jgi:hypothetical protein
MSKSIVARGIHTGSLETERTVRSSVAFDLSAIGPDHIVMAAQLHVRMATASSVVVKDASERIQYGSGRKKLLRERAIRLNGAALNDLQKACGSFFWIETTMRDGDGMSPPVHEPLCALDLVVIANAHDAIERVDPRNLAA